MIALLLLGFVDCSQGESPGVSSPPPVISAAPAKTAGIALANETFIAVAKQANASVVTIASTRKVAVPQQPFPGPSPFSDDPFFRRFFGEPFERRFPAPRERQEQGIGSGVIVSADGYIVTNHYVIEQAEEIMVLLPDKRRLKATLIDTDPKTDVAVVKIDAANLPTLSWGDSSRLQVGEVALVVGNPFGLNQTVTMDISSAVGRANMGIVDYEDFIQTVAKGRGPGEKGRGEHALAGVGVEPLAPEEVKRLNIDGGVAVTQVELGSPTDRAGLRQGDIIRESTGNECGRSRTLSASWTS